jgi:hypothetical protein
VRPGFCASPRVTATTAESCSAICLFDLHGSTVLDGCAASPSHVHRAVSASHRSSPPCAHPGQ